MQEAFATIERVTTAGVTVLLAEQNMQKALELSDRRDVLADGTVVLEDTGAALLKSSDARVCLIEADRLDVIEAAREHGTDPHVVVRGGEAGPGAAVHHAPLAVEPAVPPDALALIMYTGGTTGRPKGVLHHAVVAGDGGGEDRQEGVAARMAGMVKEATCSRCTRRERSIDIA